MDSDGIIQAPRIRPDKIYHYERRALIWVKTVPARLGLSKGRKPAIFVFEECALPLIFRPNEFPAGNGSADKNGSGHCVACKLKPYEYADSHLSHEFKENKVERNLIKANDESNKQNPMFAVLLAVGIVGVLLLAAIAYNMGIFDPRFWAVPR